MSFCRQSALLLGKFVTNHINVVQKRNIKRWVGPTLRELQRRRDKVGPEPPQPRSSFLEWNYEAELFAFGNRLGEKFDRNLLKQALIQKEYANLREIEAKGSGEVVVNTGNNDAMINEGHEIISNYISKVYSEHYPNELVEAVNKHLMSDEVLGLVGKYMGLEDIILTNECPVENKTVVNTFKAVVSALEKSTDLNRAELFVKDFLLCQMNIVDIYDIWAPENPLEYLTNLLKKKGVTEIEPRLCNESASNTILANYQVGLYSNKKLLGLGWGESISIAKDSAAINAIQRIYSSYIPKKL